MAYNKKNIMRNAWNIRRKNNVTMSEVMKAAWALEKAMMQAEVIGQESGWNYRVAANDWDKYGKSRTYISTRIYTNAWNLKREVKLGYVDNMTGKFIAA